MEGDLKHMFFTNLQLLGMDMTSMERKYKIQFNKDMFNFPNKSGSEAVLYFLFNRLNSTLCQQMFRDCWPVTDKKSEAQFRKLCCSWLHDIQKEEADARLPRINASLFLSPGGDKFCHLLFSLTTYVLRHFIRTENGVYEADMIGYPVLTQQNKELGAVMEATLTCAAIRHRKQILDTLALTAVAKQSWQNYADEVTQTLRGMKKKTRDLEREKRQHIQSAAQQAEARGSPVPASRSFHDFDMSEHTANRSQRLQKVRGMWKEVEGYVDASREEQNIISSIIDKTLEKHAIDAAHIQISVPHLMLLHCQQEIQRRQVDNIYEGGELNLISVMQLWNMALCMYIQRLKEGGLKDLSDEASEMRAQAHTHQAFLANTTLLREKLAREVPRHKKVVAKLRSQFSDDGTVSTSGVSGLEMSAPSPAVNFDLPSGHSGATPTGPAVQLSPSQSQDTPEAAADLARLISSSRPLMETFQARAFGLATLQNRNQNNSTRSVQPSKPMIQKSGLPGPVHVGRQQQQQSGRSTVGERGAGGRGVQPRVVRHFSKQPAVPPTSLAQKKSAPGRGKGSSSHRVASTPENTARGARQTVDHDTTPVPSAPSNSSAVETRRERAHNLLADKIVWAVMHGEEEDGGVGSMELPPDLGLTSDLRTFDPVASCGGDKTLIPRSSPPQTPVSRAMTAHDTSRSSVRDTSQASDLPSQHALRKSNRSVGSRVLADKGDMGDPFLRATSPVTLVQQQEAWMSGADNWGDAHSGGGVQRKRTEAGGDGGHAEASDINIEDPTAALSEEAFESVDLIGRSPLAMDISRMWRDAISDDTERTPGPSDPAVGSGWLDSDRSDPSTARLLSPRAQRSPDVVEPWSASQLDTSDRSASSEGDTARPGVRIDEEGQTLRSAGAAVDGHVEERSGGGEDRSPPSAVHRKEEEEDSSPQTMINRTMAFVTSFDDDNEDSAHQLGAEDRTLEWEERLSALHGDKNSPELSDSDSHEPFSAAALDGLFDDRTLAMGEVGVPTTATTTSSGDGVSGGLISPVVSFTPRMSQQQGSWGESSQTGAGEGDILCETSWSGQANNSGKSPARPGQKSVHFSPGESSDKENCGDVVRGAGSVTANPRPSPVGAAGVSSPRDSFSASEGGILDVTPPDIFDDDDLISFGPSSPCNESFTPLRWGMLVQGKSPSVVQGKSPSMVQGKSPAHSALGTSSSGGLFSGSGAGRAEPAAVGLDSLDEQLAAQLSKLRKMKAAAFKGLELGRGGGVGADRVKNGRAGAATSPPVPTTSSSSPSAPPPPRSTEHVGKEDPLPTQGSDPLDIFDEDDSLLLPASP